MNTSKRISLFHPSPFQQACLKGSRMTLYLAQRGLASGVTAPDMDCPTDNPDEDNCEGNCRRLDNYVSIFCLLMVDG